MPLKKIFQRHFNIIRFFIRHTAQIKKPLLYSKAREAVLGAFRRGNKAPVLPGEEKKLSHEAFRRKANT